MTPVLYESHMHTPLCNHAEGEPEEYAAVAEERGLKGIIVTCHNPIPGGWASDVRMAPDELDHYVQMVDRARQAMEGRVDVRLGMESDYVPGMERWLTKLHESHEFNHILGSVHPQVPHYFERYFRGDWFQYQQLYFEHIARAAESGLFDTMAHPDLIKNLAPHEWILERIWPYILRTLDRVAETGVAMELNTSGLNKTVPEMNPGPEILQEMAKRNIPVVIGADAHVPERVADQFEEAMNHLKEAGYNSINIFLNRERHEIEIGTALESLKKSKSF
ncbi:MAG TPA: histidinol-phosphatase [Opitutales bacterium]|nr:histidinol-phosphatase [Opitutales bacterium]